MVLTKKQMAEFEKAARPLIQYLAENFNPHVEAKVDGTSAVIVEGVAAVRTLDFVRD